MPGTTKSVNLCQFDLPSGKTCRQIALKTESLCRHHRRLNRHQEASDIRLERLANLTAHLESESLIGMLNILRRNLSGIRRVVRYYPEARLALQAVIDRIQQINATAAEAASYDSPDQLEKNADATRRLISLVS